MMEFINEEMEDLAQRFLGVFRNQGERVVFAEHLRLGDESTKLASLKGVDSYLSYLHSSCPDEIPRDWLDSLVWAGAYLGECIRSHAQRNFNWVLFEELTEFRHDFAELLGEKTIANFVILVSDGGAIATPVDLVINAVLFGDGHNAHEYALGQCEVIEESEPRSPLEAEPKSPAKAENTEPSSTKTLESRHARAPKANVSSRPNNPRQASVPRQTVTEQKPVQPSPRTPATKEPVAKERAAQVDADLPAILQNLPEPAPQEPATPLSQLAIEKDSLPSTRGEDSGIRSVTRLRSRIRGQRRPGEPDVKVATLPVNFEISTQHSEPRQGEESTNDAAAVHCRLGRRYFSDQDYISAQEEFLAALELDPGYAPAQKGIGDVFAEAGRFQDALDRYSQAVDLDDKLAGAYGARGELLMLMEEADLAIKDLSICLEFSPRQHLWRMKRADALLQINDYDAALKDFKVVASNSRANEDIYFQAHIGVGRTQHAMMRYEDAYATFSKVIKQKYRKSEVYVLRAQVYASMQNFERAILDYKRAIKVNENDCSAYNGLAWLLATAPEPDLRDSRNAIKAARKARQLAFEDEFAILDTLAAAYARADDFARAIKYQKRAIGVGTPADQREGWHRLQLYEAELPYELPGGNGQIF